MFPGASRVVGRPIVGQGTLFGAHTGHHHAPVLLTLNRLRQLGGTYSATNRLNQCCFRRDFPYPTGIARFDPPNSRTTAKLIPITFPSSLKSGPPEPPEVVWAS